MRYVVKNCQKKVAIVTLGCKVNQYETDKIKTIFVNNGWKVVDFKDKADVYIINSCSVTNLATRKTRNYLCRAKKLGGIVVLIGCYAQELENESNVKKDIEYVDIVIGNEEKNNVYEIVNKYFEKNNKLLNVTNIGECKSYKDETVFNSCFEIRQAVKIEDGCNNFCSYCIIPYVRGRVRSRSMDNIVQEVKHLANNGVKEIVLVGIEIASYGKDLKDNVNLIDVVEHVSNIEGIQRIRLGSLEPTILTEENIKRLSKIKKLCNHFHISVQSLDDSVLKNMNRKYNSDFIKERIKILRKYFEDPAITCDIIVGFPRETDEQFKNTLKNIDDIKFYEVHPFRYSKRKWTVAANIKEQVDGNIKNYRSDELIKLAQRNKNEYIKKFIGKKMNVLIESYKNGYLEGYTSNYLKVKIKGDRKLCQKTLEVELVSIEKDYILGTI